MTPHSRHSHDIGKYLSLIDDFIAGKVSAPEFEKSYLTAIKSEQRIFSDDLFAILQQLFEEADAYVQYPALRTDPEDLDDNQLHAAAISARKALRELGFD